MGHKPHTKKCKVCGRRKSIDDFCLHCGKISPKCKDCRGEVERGDYT